MFYQAQWKMIACFTKIVFSYMQCNPLVCIGFGVFLLYPLTNVDLLKENKIHTHISAFKVMQKCIMCTLISLISSHLHIYGLFFNMPGIKSHLNIYGLFFNMPGIKLKTKQNICMHLHMYICTCVYFRREQRKVTH